MGTILIVDDAEACAALLVMACSTISGIDVSTVPSAREAVRLLSDGEREIRGVITDIRMPGMDGFELIRYIRADDRYRKLPVIVVSADTDPATPEKSCRLGADAFFAKPCSPNAVRQKLEHLLDGSQ